MHILRVFNINPRDGVLAAHLLRWRRMLVRVRPLGLFLVFFKLLFIMYMFIIYYVYVYYLIFIYLNLTSNILLNSSYSQYPPRGWDAYILAFNLGALGSSPGSG